MEWDRRRVTGTSIKLPATDCIILKWQTCMKPFSFNASVYMQEELERANHNYELQESDSTVFCIDYAQNGIGSNSCGPEVQEKYQLNEEQFAFGVELILQL